MTYRTSRRRFLAGSAASAAAFPMPAIAQSTPLKIGLLTVKTGPLAAGGIHFEEGISSFLKDENFTLSGRKIDLIVAEPTSDEIHSGADEKATVPFLEFRKIAVEPREQIRDRGTSRQIERDLARADDLLELGKELDLHLPLGCSIVRLG